MNTGNSLPIRNLNKRHRFEACSEQKIIYSVDQLSKVQTASLTYTKAEFFESLHTHCFECL